MAGKRIPRKVKEQVIAEVATDESKMTIAEKYGISRNTITRWVAKDEAILEQLREEYRKKLKILASDVQERCLRALTPAKIEESSAVGVSQIAKNMQEIVKTDQLVAIQINNTVPEDKSNLIDFIKKTDNTITIDN